MTELDLQDLCIIVIKFLHLSSLLFYFTDIPTHESTGNALYHNIQYTVY